MLEREEVERMLELCASEHKWPDPLPQQVEELCRAWLAVHDAPRTEMGNECTAYGGLMHIEEPFEWPELEKLIKLRGQPVRIVSEAALAARTGKANG